MKKVKRILASMLVLALLIAMLPATVQATEGSQTTVENNSVTVEGTNGFGNLLSTEIQEEQQATEESGYSGGYSVIGLTIENGVATVEYGTLEEAILVVSLYTEDGLQLLISGTAVVQPEETVAEITLEGEMPAYFMASAYLLDTYDCSPLCSAYDTPMYTQEMQELLGSTVEDYDADRVLNLDESTDTNFAVYADTTKVIEYVEGVNTVASADDETATYIIENADENVSGLQTGEVVAYPYGENEILIVKVASVSVDGTTVTITGDELEMEEVFSHVKIEGDSGTAEVIVDDSTIDDGVVFDGVVNSGDVATYAGGVIEGEGKTEHRFCFGFDKEFDGGKKIIGSMEAGLEIGLSFYVSGSRQFVEITIDLDTVASLEISSEMEITLPLGIFRIIPVAGVVLCIEPEAVLKVEGKIKIEASFGYAWVWTFESNKGIKSYGKPKVADVDFDAEISVFIGVDLNPAVAIIDKSFLNWQLSSLAGMELTIEAKGSNIVNFDAVSNSVHECAECYDIELKLIANFSATFKFLSWFKYESKSIKLETVMMNAYWSIDYGEYLMGKCPHLKYRVTIQVTDDQEAGITGIEVQSASGDIWGCTNRYGVIVKYLPGGEYTISAKVAGQERTRTFTVSEACYISLAPTDYYTDEEISGKVNSEAVADNGIVAYGECGADGDNVVWTFYGSGLLKIEGCGEMANFSEDNIPWDAYKSYIRTVSIAEGITNIGDCAFYECGLLTTITVPNSMLSIGHRSFYNCCSLKNLELPDSVTNISWDALHYSGLTSFKIPLGVSVIEDQVFYLCRDLESVEFHEGVTEIKAYAFIGCGNLTEINLPQSLKSIGSNAFYECVGLKNITIPYGVTFIDGGAFGGCWKVESIYISESVTNIGGSAFGACGFYADNPVVITFAGDLPTIDSSFPPFADVTATAYYPADNETWTADAMKNYGGDIAWVAYTPMETATISVEQTGTIMATYSSSIVQAMSVFGGEYETEVQEEYVLKTASFSSLVPGEDYILLAMVSIEAEDVLASDNLLYIDQGTAGEDGTLVFQYVQRVNTDTSYVMACGASDKDLSDATITFPEMYADSDIQAVEPTVVYDGETLVESKDYVIVGTVDYTEAGEYTCYIRGIYDYTGLVACTYTVDPARLTLAGANMVLGSTLDMNFFINKTNLSGTDYFAEITHYAEDGTTTTTVSYDQWDERTNYMVVTLENLAARQMADKIEVVIYNSDGTQVSEVWTDSIRDYAMRILENQDTETKTMLVDMLNYGAAAQTYFEYNTADLANNQLTTEQQAYATETASCTDQRVKGDNYYGSTLVLKNRIMLTMYFQNITTDMYAMVTFTDHKGVAHEERIEGTEFAKYNDTTYGVTVDDLVVADGDQLVTVTVYNTNGNAVAYASDTVNSYATRMLTNDALFEMVAKFTTSAYAYFH